MYLRTAIISLKQCLERLIGRAHLWLLEPVDVLQVALQLLAFHHFGSSLGRTTCWGSRRGITGRMKLPNDESCATK